MGKTTGFLEIERHDRDYIAPELRLKNWDEYVTPLSNDEVQEQAARCMDCGIPFCHSGCPVNNAIPDWNDLVYREQWEAASRLLHSTNNFPEFTGRICPAPCEASCTLNIDDNPVTIKTVECAIVDRAWQEGWIVPQPASRMTGKRVAVIGSGAAGMACAQQLARAGHEVVLFEKADRVGGLLRYGIPDFKMEKHLIDRRMKQMAAEGVEFRTNVEVGVTVGLERLRTAFDAVVLSGGAEQPRDLEVPGRDLAGVHFAMDYLPQQNRRGAGDGEKIAAPHGTISAKDKHVIVIGGGDTGADCIGTAARQGAASILQIELLPKPPIRENKGLSWPNWPMKLRTAGAHQEGVERDWSILTRRVVATDGAVSALECVRVEFAAGAGGRMEMREIRGSEFVLPADLVLLAMGFLGPRTLNDPRLELDARGNIKADTEDYRTNLDKVFAAGDMRRGQSLVVWAIREGRQCARAVDIFLRGASTLPR